MPSKVGLAISTVLLTISLGRASEPGCPGSIQWDAGAGTTAWTTVDNWSSNLMPAAGDDVCIPNLGAGVEVLHSTGTHSVHTVAGNGGLQLSGGVLSFAAGSPGLGQLVLSGGTLAGTGDLPLTTFAWSAGTMTGSGTTQATSPAISGSFTKTLEGRTLQTAGTTTWIGPGTIRLNGGAVLHNLGTWDVQGNGNLLSLDGTGSLLVPIGTTFSKSGGGGLGTVAVPVTMGGTLSVTSGTLGLSGGSDVTGAILGSANATLEFSGGAHALAQGSSLSAGAVVVSAGGLTVEGTYSATSSSFSGGTTSFRPTSTVSGIGPLAIGGTAVVDLSTGETSVAATLYMSGGMLRGTDLLLLTGSGFQGASWSGGEMTGPGATWLNGPPLDVWGPAPKDLTGGRRLSTDAGVAWGGSGPIRVGGGARIDGKSNWLLQSDASIVDLGGAGGFLCYHYAEFRKAGGSGTSVIGIPFTNTGTVRASVGTLEFTAGYTQTAGTTQLDGGTLAAAAPLAIQGGILKGVGTIAASVVSSGTVAPGLSAGLLSLTGAYTQASGGTLAIEVGGSTPGTQHDRLAVSGETSLAGALNVSLMGAFLPQLGDTFTILTSSAITGSFTSRSLPSLPPGRGWLVHVNPTSVVLEVAADFDGDTVADADDCAPGDGNAWAPPLEVAGVAFDGSDQTLSWTSQTLTAGSGTVYDVVRGEVAQLPVGSGSEICLVSGNGTAQASDAAVPAPDTAFYYLVRARNACAVGTYGASRSTSACP
jgi:fibronectin-binding autotransporter adhesin